MMRRLREPVRDLDARAGPGGALGLTPAPDDGCEDERRAALRAAAAVWPAAMAVLLAVPAALIALAAHQGRYDLAVSLALRAGPALALAPACLMILTGWGRMMAHRRTAAMALAAAWIALSLSLLGMDVAAFAAGIGEAATVAVTGAAIVVAAALYPVRAASIAFASMLAAVMIANDGITAASLVATAVAALYALAQLHGGVTDQRAARARRVERADDGRARRLMGEYETHGAGWFWQTDRHGRISYLSAKVAQQLRGASGAGAGEADAAADLIGQPLTAIFAVESQQLETERTLSFHMSSRTSFSDYTVCPAAADAPERWWSISGRAIHDELGRFQGFAGWGADLTARRRADAEIARLALFDSLTGLANRQRMRLSLEQALTPQGGGHGSTGLFLLDLDRFKAVNDTLGHQVGDELLKEVAQRLQRTIGEAGLVGRLGGDEFQVVIPREGNRDRLAALADRVIAALSLPYHIDHATLSIGCSIGIAVAPLHGDSPETLVRNADLALYAAKADGRGVHRFYREELLEGAQNRKRLEDDLRQALGRDQFHLTYQPVVSTKDALIVGYEALLRWEHPQRGAISPTDFVPVAEECGLIESIGEWVMRTACMEAAGWPDHVRVAVNVSPIQFANPALPAIVTSALAASGLAPHRLELEITEGVFLNEDASSEQMFRTLKSIGVRLALDDFGTGYSSLGYLKKAPFDKIKIDQSFVRGAIQPGNRNAAIIKAIVSLADTLGMETTAEGVEQQDEIALIRDLGCSHIQGYVYGRPARLATVRDQLAAAGGYAVAIGHKTSRAIRQKMLRTARLMLGEESGEVRIRDLSATGVMIDGIDLPEEAVGYPVRIELEEGRWVAAVIRWVDDGRAGLRFDRALAGRDMDDAGEGGAWTAGTPPSSPAARRAGGRR
ncbi:diguanylate cyclase [Sphingomonas ginsenosidimutans]|jgi:diguanylate cyclase (GGDEF)-like protein|uniref:Diguanylate cyclase n=1 Tax=Sphingomonas ginsenosidimutans TaxID=862134 RepID=A0A2A4I2L6_9SPHN|nr:EAL domain-containing protein [Sphingomonas ginsenosidimutans]PCG10157.1 diguanylate cyclase [Sphingomonas ginsenosidimutans]